MYSIDLFEGGQIKKTVVIIPGGFHPFHPGHASLYAAARRAFPQADIWFAATDDRAERPFDFESKRKLAALSGVPVERFVQVKSPFAATEITSRYNPDTTALIYVRSEKDKDQAPKPAQAGADGKLPLVTRGPRKGQPVSDYLQYYKGNENNIHHMAKPDGHVYIAYLPTVQFKAGSQGISSATEIRNMWPGESAQERQKIAQDLYPAIANNAQQIQTVVSIINQALGVKVTEDAAGVGVVKNSKDPRYMTATMGDQNDVNADTLGKEMKAYHLIGPKSTTSRQQAVKQTVGKGLKESYQVEKEDLLVPPLSDQQRRLHQPGDEGVEQAVAEPVSNIPPPENARKTQIAGTLPTYHKGKAHLDTHQPTGRTLDFGAGLGGGAAAIGADSYEPYPQKGFTPTYTKADSIPDNSYERITNFNVLNVVPENIRRVIVSNIGRILTPGGTAIITTRGKDVMSAKGQEGPEPMSRITTIGTYQKGFTSKELKGYVESILGPDFSVGTLKLGPAGVIIRKKGGEITEGGGEVEYWGYAYNRRDQRMMWRRTFADSKAAAEWIRKHNATPLGYQSVAPKASVDPTPAGPAQGELFNEDEKLEPGTPITITTIKGRVYTGTVSSENPGSIIVKTVGTGGNPHDSMDTEPRNHVLAIKKTHIADMKVGVNENNRGYRHGFASPTAPELGAAQKRAFKHAEMQHELGHEDEWQAAQDSRPVMVGMYFYNIQPGQEDKAAMYGVKQTKSGKWAKTKYNKSGRTFDFQKDLADKEFGPGRWWAPNTKGVSEHIVKVAGGYELKSKHGNKNLGKYPTKAGAEKRERQVQYFKHQGMAEGDDGYGYKSLSTEQIMKLIRSGNWEAMSDIKPGRHLQLRNTRNGKNTTIHVKQSMAEGGHPWDTPEPDLLVMDYYNSGNTASEIAQQLGMDEDEVEYIIHKNEQGVAEGSSSGYTYKDTDEGTYLTNTMGETLFIPDVSLQDQGFKPGDRRLPEVWQMNLEMADETGAYIVDDEQGVAEGRVDSNVSKAIAQRILDKHHGFLNKYGASSVMYAIDVIADWNKGTKQFSPEQVGEWVQQVIRYVRTAAGEGLTEATGDAKFDAMMGGIASKESLNTREALAMMLDLIYHGGASYKEALQQASVSYEIDPAKLQAMYQQQSMPRDQLEELSKDTLRSYVPKRIEKTRGLARTDYDKANRIIKKDIPRAMTKLKDPAYSKEGTKVEEAEEPLTFTTGGNPNGTSLQGTVNTSYEQLVHAFGEPDFGPNAQGDKVTCEWNISFSDGTEATVYDWKYDETPMGPAEWNVGGRSKKALWHVMDVLEKA